MKLVTHRLGDGPRTAALIHGASASSDVWRDFAAVLVDRYDITVTTVTTVDLRGHGASPHADSYRLADFAGDLVDTLPTGLDFLIGQSLGGRASADASAALAPRCYIGLDPAFDVSRLNGCLLATFGPLQPRMPDRLLRLLQFPPAGAAPDVLQRRREGYRTWDSTMMRQLARSSISDPFQVAPPPIPSTLVLAEGSFAVSKTLAGRLVAVGWDVRVKPGAVHELHVQDPVGVADLLDDLLAAAPD